MVRSVQPFSDIFLAYHWRCHFDIFRASAMFEISNITPASSVCWTSFWARVSLKRWFEIYRHGALWLRSSFALCSVLCRITLVVVSSAAAGLQQSMRCTARQKQRIAAPNLFDFCQQLVPALLRYFIHKQRMLWKYRASSLSART